MTTYDWLVAATTGFLAFLVCILIWKVLALRGENDDLQMDMASQNLRIKVLAKANDTLRTKIERLQEMLAGKTEAVQELSDEVANLGVYAVQLQETIEDRDDRIRELEAEDPS